MSPTRMLVLYMLIVFVGTYSSIKSVSIRRGRPLISRNVNNLFGSLIPDTEIFPGLIALRLAAEESSTLEAANKCSYGVSTSMYLLDKYNNIRSSSWPAINHSSPLLGLTSPWTIDFVAVFFILGTCVQEEVAERTDEDRFARFIRYKFNCRPINK